MHKHLLVLFLFSLSFDALCFDRVYGKVTKVYAESGQFNITVADNSVPQQCGGVYFKAIKSESPHYSEMYSLVLTALTSKQSVEIVPKRCDGDRAVIDHIGIY